MFGSKGKELQYQIVGGTARVLMLWLSRLVIGRGTIISLQNRHIIYETPTQK
jgi:hypothetical protein